MNTSDVAISMSRTLRAKFNSIIDQEGIKEHDEFLIDNINNPEEENEHGIFTMLYNIKWRSENKTVQLIEELIEENENDGRLVAVEMPEHCEIGEFDKVRCFYPSTEIVIE